MARRSLHPPGRLHDMNLARLSTAVLWLALLTICGQASAADALGALLDKVAAAYGGREVLSAATAFEQFGTTASAMRQRPGRVHRAFQYPDRLRIDIRYSENDRELRVLAGATAWQQGAPVSGTRYATMLLQAARLGLPNSLLDHRDKLRDAGVITARNGDTLRALELPFHGNLRLVAGIDPATGRILESRGIVSMEQERGMEFATVYDDFRKVGDRLFAFSETHYAMGNAMGHTTLERIEVTSQLPDELFDGSQPDQPGPGQHIARSL
ncbi:MAG: hypothetical protein WBQ78_00005 [Gammaproteobacteria bacterium]